MFLRFVALYSTYSLYSR